MQAEDIARPEPGARRTMSDMLQLVVKIKDTQVMILPVASHIEPC